VPNSTIAMVISASENRIRTYRAPTKASSAGAARAIRAIAAAPNAHASAARPIAASRGPVATPVARTSAAK
jgi:hypothetical protein